MTSPDWDHREKGFRVLLFLDRPLTTPERQKIVDLFDGAQLVNLSSVDQDLAEQLMITYIRTDLGSLSLRRDWEVLEINSAESFHRNRSGMERMRLPIVLCLQADALARIRLKAAAAALLSITYLARGYKKLEQEMDFYREQNKRAFTEAPTDRLSSQAKSFSNAIAFEDDKAIGRMQGLLQQLAL